MHLSPNINVIVCILSLTLPTFPLLLWGYLLNGLVKEVIIGLLQYIVTHMARTQMASPTQASICLTL